MPDSSTPFLNFFKFFSNIFIGCKPDGFLTLVNRIIWQKPHNCGFFYVKFIKF